MSQGFAREARIGVDLHVGETLYYTANDTFTKADYEGLYGVRVEVVGAGGGAGGGEGGSDQANSGAGGGGGYSRKIIKAADLGTSETITVGSGGSGGAAGKNDGSSGGNTSFGSHATANGGAGGDGALNTSGNLVEFGGAGGAASGGDLNISGSDGGIGRVVGGTYIGQNKSGASLLGGGVGTSNSASDGADAVTPGEGGGAAVTTSTNRAGGDGADGIVIVEVLYERKIAVDEDIHTQYALSDGSRGKGARLERSTAQTISATTFTAIEWETEVQDDDGYADLGTNNTRLTVSGASWYIVAASARFNANDATRYIGKIQKNGTTDIIRNDIPATNSLQAVPVSVPVFLADGDYLEYLVWHDDSSSENVLANSSTTYFTVVRLV